MANDTAFSNQLVELAHVDTATIEKTPVLRHYAWVDLIESAIWLLVITASVVAAVYQPIWPLPEIAQTRVLQFWGIVAALWVLLEIYSFFAIRRMGYCLREQDITLFKGLLFRKVVSQPICRIQHVEVKQGPIELKFNLAKLHVFSAGDISQTFIIPGIYKDTAEELRQFILNHKELQRHG